MQTSNFKNYTGDKGISVCLYPPYFWVGPSYPKLFPPKDIFFLKKADRISEKEYEKAYRDQVLSKIDPMELLKILGDSVLLCWEQPGEFCHRRIIARWIEENTGKKVPEWKPDNEITEAKSKELF